MLKDPVLPPRQFFLFLKRDDVYKFICVGRMGVVLIKIGGIYNVEETRGLNSCMGRFGLLQYWSRYWYFMGVPEVVKNNG